MLQPFIQSILKGVCHFYMRIFTLNWMSLTLGHILCHVALRAHTISPGARISMWHWALHRITTSSLLQQVQCFWNRRKKNHCLYSMGIVSCRVSSFLFQDFDVESRFFYLSCIFTNIFLCFFIYQLQVQVIKNMKRPKKKKKQSMWHWGWGCLKVHKKLVKDYQK